MKLKIVRKGGSGSGNFGHSGRPGEVGGSAPGSISMRKIANAFANTGSQDAFLDALTQFAGGSSTESVVGTAKTSTERVRALASAVGKKIDMTTTYAHPPSMLKKGSVYIVIDGGGYGAHMGRLEYIRRSANPATFQDGPGYEYHLIGVEGTAGVHSDYHPRAKWYDSKTEWYEIPE